MALLMFEGFDSYGTAAQLSQQANLIAAGSGGNPSIDTTIPRTGRACMGLGNTAYLRSSFTLSGTTIIVGFAAYWQTFHPGCRMRLLSTTTNRSGLSVGLNASGNLVVGRGGPTVPIASGSAVGTALWTSSDMEPILTWQYYELRVVMASTAVGSWELRRNGQLVQAQTNVITLENVADVINSAIFDTTPGIVLPYFLDDIYICDGSGTANNNFLGPARVYSLAPTANSSVAWTPTPSPNWDAVNDAPPDEETSYVRATTAPLIDMYQIADLPVSLTTVRCVRALYRVRKEDAAAVETRLRIQSGATVAEGPVDAPDTTYRYFVATFETDPNTGAAWTPAAVNALLAGFRRAL